MLWPRLFVLLCLSRVSCSFPGCSFIVPSAKVNGLLSLSAPGTKTRCATAASQRQRLHMLWADGAAGGEAGGEAAQPEQTSRKASKSSPSSSSVGSGLLDALRESHSRQLGQASSGSGLLGALQSGGGESNLLEQIMRTTVEDKRAVGELEQENICNL
jgi:hypothetical protein